MPNLKLSEYPVEALTLSSGDLLDVSKLLSTGPNIYESQKVDYNTFYNSLPIGNTIYTGNGTLTEDRVIQLLGNRITFGDDTLPGFFHLNLKEIVDGPLVFQIHNAHGWTNSTAQLVLTNDLAIVGGIGATGSDYGWSNYIPDALFISTAGAQPLFFAGNSSAHSSLTSAGGWGFGVVNFAALTQSRVAIKNSGFSFGLGITVDGTASTNGFLFKAEATQARISTNGEIPIFIEQNTNRVAKFYNDFTNKYVGIGNNTNSNPSAFMGSNINSIGYIRLHDTNDLPLVQILPASGEVTYFRGQSFFGIGTNIPDATLHIKGTGSTDATYAIKIENSATSSIFSVQDSGKIKMGILPTSSAGLSAGDLWNNSGVVNIV